MKAIYMAPILLKEYGPISMYQKGNIYSIFNSDIQDFIYQGDSYEYASALMRSSVISYFNNNVDKLMTYGET